MALRKFKVLKAILQGRKTMKPGGDPVDLDPETVSTKALVRTGFITPDLGEPSKTDSNPPPPAGGLGADDGKGKGKGK